jgi:hypothetical protein
MEGLYHTVGGDDKGKPNSTLEAEDPSNGGAVPQCGTGHFQAPARQLTPQADLKATPREVGAVREILF